MRSRTPIPYRTPERFGSHEDQDGVIGFGLGLGAICILLVMIVSVRDNWNRSWPPLLLVAGFVAAVLGLIAAVPAALQRERRKSLALTGIVVNVVCLGAQLVLVVLYYRLVGGVR